MQENLYLFRRQKYMASALRVSRAVTRLTVYRSPYKVQAKYEPQTLVRRPLTLRVNIRSFFDEKMKNLSTALKVFIIRSKTVCIYLEGRNTWLLALGVLPSSNQVDSLLLALHNSESKNLALARRVIPELCQLVPSLSGQRHSVVTRRARTQLLLEE